MIPQSANHDHVRLIYINARAEEERREAMQFLAALVAAFTIFAGAIVGVVAHFWRP